MKVLGYVRDDGACGFYRVAQPFRHVAKNTDMLMGMIQKGDPLTKIFANTDADIIVIPRPNDDQMLEFMRTLKDLGKKLVVDHDDNMFTVSPLSPHYQDFGVEDVVVQTPQGKVKLWTDGDNYNKQENQHRLDNFKRALELVDLVTVTTDILGDVYKEYNDNIAVLPNCVDPKEWTPLPLKKENPEEIRLFWSGGSSHYEDMTVIQDVLPHILKKYPNVSLHLLGSKWDGTLQDCPEEQIHYVDWVPTPAYPYQVRITNPDISLIPLMDTEFSRCKSAIKWIEQSALLVPSVASLVSPYQEVYDGTNGVFIENNSVDGWIAGIEYLIENPLDRWNMATKAHQTVKENFDITKEYQQWYNTYKELHDGS